MDLEINQTIDPVTPAPEFAEQPNAPAGTNVFCSPSDLARLLSALLPAPDPGIPLFTPQTRRDLAEPVGSSHYSRGGWSLEDNDVTLTHNGDNGRNFAVVFVEPRRNSALVVMTNVSSPEGKAAVYDMAGTLRDTIRRRGRSN